VRKKKNKGKKMHKRVKQNCKKNKYIEKKGKVLGVN
jgi:hypothetical protein